LYFNTADNKIKLYSNAAWGDLGGGTSLWIASGTAATFDNDVYVGGGLYVQGQRVICPAGQDGTDNFCDYVCTDYYEQSGTEGAVTTEYCYNKTALTSENCGAVGGCKASDYTNCNSQSNSTLQYECEQCKYINTVNCVNNVLGSCTNYDTDIYCAYDGYDNSATNYHCSAGTCVCDSSTYTLVADGKDNDCDGAVDELTPNYGCAVLTTNQTCNAQCTQSGYQFCDHWNLSKVTCTLTPCSDHCYCEQPLDAGYYCTCFSNWYY